MTADKRLIINATCEGSDANKENTVHIIKNKGAPGG